MPDKGIIVKECSEGRSGHISCTNAAQTSGCLSGGVGDRVAREREGEPMNISSSQRQTTQWPPDNVLISIRLSGIGTNFKAPPNSSVALSHSIVSSGVNKPVARSKTIGLPL